MNQRKGIQLGPGKPVAQTRLNKKIQGGHAIIIELAE